MKRLLAFVLVLSISPLANATFLDMVTDGVGDSGHAGTSGDPLVVGETIDIKIVLNYYDSAAIPTYDGYALSMLDLDLSVSGPGSLGEWKDGGPKGGDGLQHHPGLTAWYNSPVTPTGINSMTGADGIYGIYPGPQDIVWNLFITCTGAGTVTVDLGIVLAGGTQYSLQGYPATWVNAVDADLGDLAIHNVPEPMTIALLGLGGLLLLRKRRD